MDHFRTAQWLFQNAGPVIRYRIATECPQAHLLHDDQSLTTELFENETVRRWLTNLKPYDTLYAEARLGIGLGTGGHSSFLHGSTDMNFEVVLPKLAQLGLRAGMPLLDEKTLPWLHLLEGEVKRDIDSLSREKDRFLSAVYYHYDYRLIIASSLAMAGYTHHEAVQQVLQSRIEAIYAVIQYGNFDIYEEPGKYTVHPKEWTNQLLRWELYSDGNIKLPFVHDIFAFSSIYKHSRHELERKIDAIVEWALSAEHQRFHYNFGYIRCPDGRGKSVGFKMDFPGYFGFEGPDFDPRSLILRCWQMAHFPSAREHPWFQQSMRHLESFTTDKGTYIFPNRYLTETKSTGYWVHGSRMGLGENRRNRQWSEIESTFWMLAIQLAMQASS
jgi:hypothetical protein